MLGNHGKDAVPLAGGPTVEQGRQAQSAENGEEDFDMTVRQ